MSERSIGSRCRADPRTQRLLRAKLPQSREWWSAAARCRPAAMTSSAQASRTLLKLYEHSGLAAQIKAGKPLPPQVSRMLDVLTAGTGAPGEIGSWE
jgi:hypothetical protein